VTDVQVTEIMKLVSDKKLIELGKEYGVDKVNHKITGAFILKSFVRSSLLGRPISLRSIEEITPVAGDVNNLLKTKKRNKKKVDHSSIGKRLRTIKTEYFQAIYNDLVEQYNYRFSKAEKQQLYRFDSTTINLSGRIIKDGLRIGGKKNDSQVKLSVGLKCQIPASVRFCNDKSEASEDIALVMAINESKLDKEDILLFDRGICSTISYQEFENKGIKFVTRVKNNRRYKPVKTLEFPNGVNDKNLQIQSDEVVNLYRGKKVINCNLRLVKAINDQGEEFSFLTNLFDSAASEIADIYKKRWDIEVFFKFVKQHLQFKHFISHSQNGMIVYLYSILVAAILFTIFKVSNKLAGFKIPLLKFCLLLEKEIIRDIVVLSGGDFELVRYKL
ncbi:MAG: IS4 family transposase, partial [Nostocales cyanobacterium ELA608]